MALLASRKNKVKIKDLPASDRPREKLFEKGAENLSDAELIALLLSTGTKKYNTVKLAEVLLKQFPLKKLSTVSQKELLETHGIGEGKAGIIFAALELGQRIFAPVSLKKIILRTSDAILSECRNIIDKKQEHLL